MLIIKKYFKICISIGLFLLLNISLVLAAPPTLYPNFPKFIGPASETMMPFFGSNLAEIDSIPGAEIVLHLADANLHVWNYQGVEINGFPKSESPFIGGGSAVGDLDGDGKNEIVNIDLNGWLDIVDNQGTSWANFPIYTGIHDASPPVLSDLGDDGQKEIIFYHVYGKDFYVYRTDGTFYPGWPKVIQSITPGFIYGVPAVGDVDGDGYKEIVAFAFDSCYIWRYTGELLEGWPRAPKDTTKKFYGQFSPPVLADIDKDGKLDIVAGEYGGPNWPEEGGVLAVYNWKGDLLPGWPRYLAGTMLAGPVVGDLDKDGSLEIIAYTYNYLNVLKSNGDFYPGWPKDIGLGLSLTSSEPILVDLDDDDTLDIFFATHGGYSGSEIFAYSLKGELLEGYPFKVNGIPGTCTPAVGDVDNSDSLSLLIVSEWASGGFYAYVYLYNLGVPYKPSSVQWGTYGHNNRRTNNYHDNDICLAKPGDATGDTLVDFSDIVKIVDYLFRGDSLSGPQCSFDPNFDRKIRLSDVVYLINYLFKNGIPPIPYDDCCVGN